MSKQQDSLTNLLGQVLAEQIKQTAILERMATQQAQLFEALGEDEPEDPDAAPRTYMDGSRVT